MKKYFYIPGQFANVYNLVYCESDTDFKALPENAEQITRTEALSLCRQESRRRKHNASFSGYAPINIFPASFDGNRQNPQRYGLEIVDHIAERVSKDR